MNSASPVSVVVANDTNSTALGDIFAYKEETGIPFSQKLAEEMREQQQESTPPVLKNLITQLANNTALPALTDPAIDESIQEVVGDESSDVVEPETMLAYLLSTTITPIAEKPAGLDPNNLMSSTASYTQSSPPLLAPDEIQTELDAPNPIVLADAAQTTSTSNSPVLSNTEQAQVESINEFSVKMTPPSSDTSTKDPMLATPATEKTTKIIDDDSDFTNGHSSNQVLMPATTMPALTSTALIPLLAPPTFAVNSNSSANLTQMITPQVGTLDWNEALGQKINWMALGAHQSASLTLNPPDLGPLQVVIHVHNQHADATFISHQPEVRAALENAIPTLREMMEQAGIQLGECNVNSQPKPQDFGQAEVDRGSNGGDNVTQVDDMTGTTNSMNADLPAWSRSDHGLVNLFV